MASDAWKQVERTVAGLLGGVRAWQTDHDVLVFEGDSVIASVEVKNLTAPTVAQLERFLIHNQAKITRDYPGAVNALVVKRKAGPGRSTPYLLVMPLS